jgi:glycosyltransferase involved in cell wall biosynthesis
MKKILYILTRFPVATETFILNELRQVLRQGMDYHLFTFRLDRQMAASAPYSEVPARRLPASHSPEATSAFLACLATRPVLISRIIRQRWCKRVHHLVQATWLAKWCIRNDIGHIHAHYAYHSTSAARVISALTGITYSFTAHANDIFKSSWQMGEKIRDSLFCATCTGYNKDYLIRRYAADFPEKVHRIYHGIDTSLFSPPEGRGSTDKLRLVTVARLREKKGLDFLIRAAAELADRSVPFQLHIVGDGPDRQRLEALAQGLGVADRIRFTGALPHPKVKEMLADADLFVLPSIIASDGSRDGIPNVILEAMAMELPVISTHVSAIPEAVVHQDTGILVPPQRSRTLADSIMHLWRHPEERLRLGKRGRKRVEQLFELERNTRLLVDLFETALRQGKGAEGSAGRSMRRSG